MPNGIDLSNSVENEYLCLKLLGALGVPTAHAEIAVFSGCRTLIVERFDRRWTRDGRLLRLPQEDMCQALSVPPTRKYQSDGGPAMRDIIELLKGSDTPELDLAMSAGKSKHYLVDSIMPRHFLQTAVLAGVGEPLMRKIFEDIAANAEKQTEVVFNTLPRGFPDQLVTSVRVAVKSRINLIANVQK